MVFIDASKMSEKQRQFMEAKERHVAYGGARGGGKSWAVRTKAKILACQWPGIRILIVRRTYKELYNNHMLPLEAELAGVAVLNRTNKMFIFPNGSTIQFGYCANDGDLMQYQGAEYDVIFIDEAGQLREDWIRKLNTSIRGTNGFPKRCYYTLNPGGVSHDYFKRLFVLRQFKDNEKPEEHLFIQALAQENKALMEIQPEYIDELRNLPEKLREAWLNGSWDAYEGQFFDDFRTVPDLDLAKKRGCGLSAEELKRQRRFTHVIEPFTIPPGWKICRSYDFGFGKPFSVGWWAIDYDGVLYRIYEWYGYTGDPNVGLKLSPDAQFAEIARLERELPIFKGRTIEASPADPSIWDASRGESIAETAARHGVYFVPGDNNRIPGWMQIHYRLQFDENGYAGMYIFDTCRDFIRTMPIQMFSETHPEDLDTKLEDHIADETRYMCMSRPIKPVIAQEAEIPIIDPLDLKNNRRIYL